MAGTAGAGGTCQPCAPCACPSPAPRQRRYPEGRHCERLNESGNCRCSKWGRGKGEKVSSMCKRAGREMRIGARVIKP